jgi:NifU-like protein involved in Fe-S cluster formation
VLVTRTMGTRAARPPVISPGGVRTVADHVADPRCAGPLDGADAVSEAMGGLRLVVRIGLWREEGRIVRARFRASTCASLLAYADAACTLVEAGALPEKLEAAALRAAVAGVHPGHHDRAELVAAAMRAASARAEEAATP